MKNRFQNIVVFLFMLMSVQAWAQKENSEIRKGNKQYEEQNFVESEISYRKALEKNPNSDLAQFNLADALFKQKKYDEALKIYEGLASKEKDAQKLAQLYHNIGNSYMAKNEIDKGISSYKTALKNNPMDDETRYNYIAANKMKQEQEKQKNQQQQQQQQKQEQKTQEQQQNQQQQEQEQQNAQQVLDALAQDEKQVQEKVQRAKKSERKQIEKNW